MRVRKPAAAMETMRNRKELSRLKDRSLKARQKNLCEECYKHYFALILSGEGEIEVGNLNEYFFQCYEYYNNELEKINTKDYGKIWIQSAIEMLFSLGYYRWLFY